MIGIYSIFNKISKKYYIGLSSRIENRWKEHKRDLNKGKHCNKYLQNSWNKYGEENFEFDIVEECEISELKDKEIFYIGEYVSLFPYGYNLTLEGDYEFDDDLIIARTLKKYNIKREDYESVRRLGDFSSTINRISKIEKIRREKEIDRLNENNSKGKRTKIKTKRLNPRTP